MNDRSTSDGVELGAQIGALELSSVTVSITDDGVLEATAASAGPTVHRYPNTACSG